MIEQATGALAPRAPRSRPAGRELEALLDELAVADAALEGADPAAALSWVFERFGHGVVVTSSFQDCVLADLAASVRPGVRVVFLDTGFHFPETLAYLRRVERVLPIDVEVVSAGLPDDEHPCGTASCCELRKVGPLQRCLVGAAAWVTGLKRCDAPTRAAARTVAWDDAKGVVKVNPIVAWSEDDVAAYVDARGLPRHPLNALGYTSIGCAPTTAPPLVGGDLRSGRWVGSSRTECGLHG
ncbi:MAG: phosphoadenylyl-sulfate reductase [Actinomycetota bacterium]|nr:phosphoadenylyl-sulfate reductase [Actinomycetota bacterium]